MSLEAEAREVTRGRSERSNNSNEGTREGRTGKPHVQRSRDGGVLRDGRDGWEGRKDTKKRTVECV